MPSAPRERGKGPEGSFVFVSTSSFASAGPSSADSPVTADPDYLSSDARNRPRCDEARRGRWLAIYCHGAVVAFPTPIQGAVPRPCLCFSGGAFARPVACSLARPSPTPKRPVVPFVPPLDSEWAPPRFLNVREVTSDALFHARCRSDQNTVPNQERDHRLHHTTRLVTQTLLTAAEYIGRCKRDGYLNGRRVAEMMEFRILWDKHLDRSTARKRTQVDPLP